ncbi:MAG TPA: sodium:proton exchanger [Myxococcaceae bacterium]|nr:sodium:proton exchanger [Myxococcaceae bacterium]
MRTLLLLVTVAALSVLASNPRLLRAGSFFNLAQLSASGLLFLVLGAVIGPSGANLLTRVDLEAARPLLALGLGLGGVLLGLNLEPAILRALPRRVWAAAGAQSVFAFVAVAVPIAAIFLVTRRLPPVAALGAAAVLGGAASVSSSHLAVLSYRAGRLDRLRGLSVALVAMLDDLTGIAVLALALVLGGAADPLAGAGLVALALVLGVSCGALTAYLIHESTESAELMALLIGAVGLVSGVAAFLRVSALLAGLACGATLAVVGGRQVGLVFRALARTERPVYLTLLFLVGAHVELPDWHAWAILPVFVGLRFLGKLIGGRVAVRAAAGALHLPSGLGYALIGQGGVSLCVLVEYLRLVGGSTSQLIFDVGVLAAIANEALGIRSFPRSTEPDLEGDGTLALEGEEGGGA